MSPQEDIVRVTDNVRKKVKKGKSHMKRRFRCKMWGATYRGYFLPGFFVFKTRKEAWKRIMSRVSDKTKREAMRRGWRVCKLDAVLTITDLPTKKQLDIWDKRYQRVLENRLDELSKRKNILNKDGSEVVIAEQ